MIFRRFSWVSGGQLPHVIASRIPTTSSTTLFFVPAVNRHSFSVQQYRCLSIGPALYRRHRGLSRDYRDRNKVSKKAARDEHQTNDTKTKKGSSDATNKDTPKKPEFNFDFNFDNQDPQKMPDMKYSMALLFSILFIYLAYKQFKKRSEEQKMYNEPLDSFEITWTDFLTKLVVTGEIEEIIIFPSMDAAIVRFPPWARSLDNLPLKQSYKVRIPDIGILEHEVRRTESEAGLPPEKWAPISIKRNNEFAGILILISLFLLVFYFMRKGMKGINFFDMMSETLKHRIKIIDPKDKNSNLKIKFKDVAGLHEAKVEISEFIDYLRIPSKYTKLGARLPKGALMTGPPGCGKTLLAKALAAESSVPFISINGTEFMEMIGGLGARRIRNLFKTAKSRAPCIIFIDEIDAIGGKRRDNPEGEIGEAEHTLNQLLVEMDGMDSAQGVVVIAGTNRPDTLDKALLRPGRFDRHISVDLPTLLERKELFELYLRRIKMENRLLSLSHRFAQMTTGFSGADIMNVVNEAAIHAATAQKKMVTIDDIDYAMNKIIGGLEKKSKTLAEEERHTVAVHEAGHALVGWLLEHTDALLKVTIIPRTSAALGFAQYTPKDRYLHTKDELFDQICMMLGGRVAENVVFGRITTGAQNDLEKVREQAYDMTKKFGMSTVLGPLSFKTDPSSDEKSSEFLKKPYSKKLAAMIDQEVRKLVNDAHDITENLLKENRNKLDTIAKELLKKEVLTYEDVRRLIGPPKFGDKQVIDLSELFEPSHV